MASLNDLSIANFSLETNKQANSTNAEKIEDTISVFINYSADLNLSDSVRIALCRIMVGLKKRVDFEINLEDFGGKGVINLEYLGGDIINGYSNQMASDAYKLQLIKSN